MKEELLSVLSAPVGFCAPGFFSFFPYSLPINCLLCRLNIVEAFVAEWLTPQTPDLEVPGSSLSRCIVSRDKELLSTLSLFTQVYK